MDILKKAVLIETYWNVNKNDREVIGFEGAVLIETYWNVNEPFLMP